MWGLMTPAILIIYFLALIIAIPLLIGAITVVTWLGNAMGLGT
jgi:hypothetical protein